MVTGKLISLLACLATATAKPPCLYKGCSMTAGLKVIQLNNTISQLGKDLENTMRILQWNILYDKNDIGQDNWVYRKREVCDYIRKLKPTLIGLQEVMPNQLSDLSKCLAPLYDSVVGTPRDNSNKTQYNPIFYLKSEHLRLVDSGTFWLSKTQTTKGSLLENAKEPRICTWAEFRFKTLVQGKHIWKPFFFATTHLAWRHQLLAAEQVDVLLGYLKNTIMKGGTYPAILTGDMNWEANSIMYKTIVEDNTFQNTMATADKTLYATTALPPYEGIKDYIWVRHFRSLLSATMMDTRQNGHFLSDHRAVFALVKYV